MKYFFILASVFLTGCCKQQCLQEYCFVESLPQCCYVEGELTVEEAVQIALVNNPTVQATLEEIGIAQADLLEAGLLSNPIFDIALRFTNKKGYRTNTELNVTQNFIDILLIPLKKRVASAELERVQFQVANILLQLSFEVEKKYTELAAAQKEKELLQDIVELAEIANQISIAQGNTASINSVDLQLRTAEYLKRTVELTNIEVKIIKLREDLNRLLGLSGWSIPSGLPILPDSEPNFDCFEQMALQERLDILEARWEVERLRREFPTIEWWAFTDFSAGVSSAREPEKSSPWTTGPAFAGRLPIFNFGQADRKRLAAQYRQAEAKLAALEIKVSADVREAKDRLLVFRNQVLLYHDRILPNLQKIVDATETQYNMMSTGIYDLLDTKRNQLTSLLHYEMALEEYWKAKIDLEMAIGLRKDS